MFGDIRRATNCPLCRVVFRALRSADSLALLCIIDKRTIYYSHELLVEYKKMRIDENDYIDVVSVEKPLPRTCVLFWVIAQFFHIPQVSSLSDEYAL